MSEKKEEKQSFLRSESKKKSYGTTRSSSNLLWKTEVVHHDVRPGDTLEGLAVRYGVTVSAGRLLSGSCAGKIRCSGVVLSLRRGVLCVWSFERLVVADGRVSFRSVGERSRQWLRLCAASVSFYARLHCLGNVVWKRARVACYASSTSLQKFHLSVWLHARLGLNKQYAAFASVSVWWAMCIPDSAYERFFLAAEHAWSISKLGKSTFRRRAEMNKIFPKTTREVARSLHASITYRGQKWKTTTHWRAGTLTRWQVTFVSFLLWLSVVGLCSGWTQAVWCACVRAKYGPGRIHSGSCMGVFIVLSKTLVLGTIL